VDANARPLKKISEKIHRQPKRGGARNALFVQAAVEALPKELEGLAAKVQVQFPWGSLLHSVATGEYEILRNLRRICCDNAWLEIIIGWDPTKDHTELKRLCLPDLSLKYFSAELLPRYRSAGFETIRLGMLSPSNWPSLYSSWAQRLRQNPARVLIHMLAQAMDMPAT